METVENQILFSFQYLTIASANGCSDLDSSQTAICKIKSWSYPSTDVISVTSGFHSVIVQVLSKTIISTLQRVSSGSHHLIRIHFSAHLPVHTIRAVGVARPNAHGQAITITAAK
ncbi:MAG: hypothetical protein PHR06_16430 [Candidatus Cloacimonetes bacterium]|nr:hypothetical protein [Candidatus Cloacimonadota bacterium]